MIIEISMIVLICLLFCGGCWAHNNEKKMWNDGRCKECGEFWVHFDTDSQGGRGYKCPKCAIYIWISYGIDKKWKRDRSL